MNLVNTKKTKNVNQNRKPIIVVMTRWHAIFRCKSRLTKDIGALKAAKIQEKLTNHTISVVRQVHKQGYADVKVAIDGIGINAAKKWALKNKINMVATQGAGNLGTKMKRQFLKTYSEKNISHQIPNSILVIGTDLPSISSFDLINAIKILNHREMVMGPSKDGGYWLIGFSYKLLNPLFSWPFTGMSWGTDKVLQKTVSLATLNKIDYQLLQQRNDLDTILDLSPWVDSKSLQISASSYQL